jgi:hypothetical protein
VVGDIRHDGLTAEPRHTVFLAQFASARLRHIHRHAHCEGCETDGRTVRREVRQVDPSQPVADMQPIEQYISAALDQPRFYAVLLGAFASLAL